MKIQIVIPGEAVGQHRPRMFARCPGNVTLCAKGACRPFSSVYTEPKDKAWRKHAEPYFKAAYQGPRLEGPLGLSLLVVFTMPAGEHRVAAKPRRWHVARPDVDNLAKAVMDSATAAGWWKDDTQVSRLVVEKVAGAQGEAPCIKIAVYALEPYGSDR